MAEINAYWIQQTPAAADMKVRGGAVLRGAARADRQPVHLVFLLDRSGSMAGDRLRNVKRSLQFLLQLMTSADMITVIAYDDDAQVILNRSATTAEEKPTISYKIDQLRDQNCTNMSAALLLARQSIGAPAAADGRPFKEGIVFLTDGHANRGVSDKTGLLNIVERTIAENPGLSISSVAYGEDHNVDLLSSMGTAGGGSYNIVNTLEHVATVFGNILGGLASITAQNVSLHLPPGVIPLTQYKTVAHDDGTTEVRIGDVYAEVELTVLFEGAPAAAPQLRIVMDDVLTLAHTDATVDVAPLAAGEQPPKILEVAVFRHEVSTLLLEMSKYPRAAALAALKERAEGLLATLKALPYAEENLIQMMVEDLERLLESADHVEAGGYLSADMTTAMAQHAGYMGLGRGERSAMPELPRGPPAHIFTNLAAAASGGVGTPVAGTPDASDDEGASSPAPVAPSLSAPPAPLSRTRTARVDNYSSPFHSRLQATASMAMRVSSQQDPSA